MYLPEGSVRTTLQMVALHSAPGSSLVLDYANSIGIEFAKNNPQGPGGIPAAWGEPWIFGVPGADGRAFFGELGFDPGVPMATTSPELIKRYTTRSDGTRYGAKVFRQDSSRSSGTCQGRNIAPIDAGPCHGCPKGHRSGRRHLLAY